MQLHKQAAQSRSHQCSAVHQEQLCHEPQQAISSKLASDIYQNEQIDNLGQHAYL